MQSNLIQYYLIRYCNPIVPVPPAPVSIPIVGATLAAHPGQKRRCRERPTKKKASNRSTAPTDSGMDSAIAPMPQPPCSDARWRRAIVTIRTHCFSSLAGPRRLRYCRSLQAKPQRSTKHYRPPETKPRRALSSPKVVPKKITMMTMMPSCSSSGKMPKSSVPANGRTSAHACKGSQRGSRCR